MSSQENASDLNAILRTLSAFSNKTTSQSHQQPAHSYSHNNEDNYEPPDVHPQSTAQSQTKSQIPRPISKPHPIPSPQSQPQDKPTASSSSITTWPAALRQVMRTVAQSEDIQQRIRYLIARQHDHERQWWKGREALLQKQSSRKEKKRELDEVLRKVGAPVDEKEVSTVAEDLAEITNYDAKVHRASKQMADAMLAELKALDVPFFCISKSLVVITEGMDKKTSSSSSGSPGSTTMDKQGKLSLEELVALQRRMLELLQDLCRE
ncbi:hypothetical protein BDV06DRAFT_2114 [Aspergillus oleicola]